MSVKLDVKYKSQVGPTAGYSHNDCGPACVNMMLAAAGTDVTIDSMYTSGPARQLLSTGLLSLNTLIQLADAYGLKLSRHSNSSGLTYDGLKTMLEEGRPALLLIDYRPIVTLNLNTINTSGYFGHFVVCVGYEDDDTYYIHDPYHKDKKGEYLQWSEEVMEACWNHGRGSSGNYYARACLVPPHPIAEPTEPPYPIGAPIKRRLKAKALFEGTAAPRVTNDDEYMVAMNWLENWGTTTETYTVQRGDSLSKIALRLYNNADMWSMLAAFNGIGNPNALEVGDEVEYPIVEGKMADEPEDEKKKGDQPYTNRQVINAFYRAYKEFGPADDVDAYWDAIVELKMQHIVEDRDANYRGRDLTKIEGIPEEIKADILKRLKITK